MMRDILIIKHGAFGDIMLATAPIRSIREAYPEATITLLTTKAYASLMDACPWVDRIWIDEKPKAWQVGKVLVLRKLLLSVPFDAVFDLQTSQRSTAYFPFFARKGMLYSGLHPKGSHPHNTPERTSLHTIDRQKQQLEIAGLTEIYPPDIHWLEGDISSFDIPSPYLLMIPGGSAHRPGKRWPEAYYADVALWLIEHGVTPVLVGGKAEADILSAIAKKHSAIVNLCAKTDFAQIATLARGARGAIGNDTGPTHLIALTGCKCAVLFNTDESDPAKCAPRGNHVRVFAQKGLDSLGVPAINQWLEEEGIAHVASNDQTSHD